MPEPAPAFQYADLAQQHDTAQLGMWTFLATEVLFFGGTILAYAVYRYGYPEAFAEAGRHTHITIGTANAAILLTSSFFVVWAVEAAKNGAGRLAALLLWAAAAIGIALLALKGYEYSAEFSEVSSRIRPLPSRGRLPAARGCFSSFISSSRACMLCTSRSALWCLP